MDIATPSKEEVEKYLIKWKTLENYILQEKSLDKLFFEVLPENKQIEDILIKCSTLKRLLQHQHILNIPSSQTHTRIKHR